MGFRSSAILAPTVPTKRSSRAALWWIPLGVFLAIFVAGMEWRFPLIGYDFLPFMNGLLEGRWHFAHYGLRPMLYAVHLCGGMPVAGHPNFLYWSLPQMLTLVLDPWRAMQLSVMAFLAAGYAGWRMAGRDVLRLTNPWAHAFAMMATANGFLFLHVMAGHVNFFPFPLIGWCCWLLLGPESRRMPLALRASLFALLSGLILYAGGYFVLIYFGVLLALSAPLLLLHRRELSLPPPGILFLRSGGLILAALLLCAGKLVAVASLMQAFPRTVPWGGFPFGASPAYVLRALWAIPQDAGLFRGIPPGVLHEQSVFFSPVILWGLLVALAAFFSSTHRRRGAWTLAYCLGLVLLCLLTVSGTGVTQVAAALPIFSSMRGGSRFLFVFMLIFSGIACVALQSGSKAFRGRESLLPGVAIALTIIAFVAAYFPVLWQIHLPIHYDTFRGRLDHLEARDFTRVTPTTLIAGDTEFLDTVGIVCSYDALFHWAKHPQEKVLVPGPARLRLKGYFNMMNPACYAYGPANNCKPGDRIAASDRRNLENFLSGGPLTWRVSGLQTIADVLSILALTAATAVSLDVLVQRAFPKKSASKNKKKARRHS